jgi:uncharacterized membrane protein YbhN (UPF0104 family)
LCVSVNEGWGMNLSISRIVLSAAALAALVAVAATPQLLGSKVMDAFGALHGADPSWLVTGGALFALAFLASVAAWRAALGASGGRICALQATARIGVGSLVNSVAPAKLGDAVKIALCSRAIQGPDRLWTAGGVYAGLGAARCLTVAIMVAAASLTGAMPIWPVFVLCGGVAAIAAVGLSSRRMRRHHRIAHLLEGIAALERSPRAAAAAVGWTAGAAAARLAATAAVAAALDVPHPMLAALVIMPAIDLAGVIPLTPGNVGVASGAVALALQSRGIGVTQALGVGIAIQALETLVSLVAGSLGGLYLLRPQPAVRRWAPRVAAVGTSVGLAALVGVLVFDLV